MKPILAIVLMVQVPNVLNYVTEIMLLALILLWLEVVLLIVPILGALLLNGKHRVIASHLLLIAGPSKAAVGDVAKHVFLIDKALLNLEFLLVDGLLHVRNLLACL